MSTTPRINPDEEKIFRAAIERARETALELEAFGETHRAMAARHRAFADRLEARLAEAQRGAA